VLECELYRCVIHIPFVTVFRDHSEEVDQIHLYVESDGGPIEDIVVTSQGVFQARWWWVRDLK